MNASDEPMIAPSLTFDARGLRIGIFIIAYNAERHIEKTLNRIPEAVWREVAVAYVIDDCSTDETVGRALAFRGPADRFRVLRNRTNRRYGGNQKLGYQYALDEELDVVVMLHADGQYAPEVLPEMLAPIVDDQADIVIGSRMIHRPDALRGGMPRYKYVGNIVLTGIQNRLTGMSLSEFHSGYRAYRTTFLRSVPFWENSDEWHFDTQILLQARQAGARLTEIPIPVYYGDEICHVNGIVYGIHCIASSFFFWLYRLGIVYMHKYDVTLKGPRYVEKFSDPNSSHSLIWKRLEQELLRGTKILELGVGDASLTRKLAEAGAIVDAIEIDSQAASLAQPYCRHVLIADANSIERAGLTEKYDIVIAADVLEHLVNPELVLSRLKGHLRKGGLLIVSLPNIANIYVRLNLLLGRYPTDRRGILDETHLHAYTLTTMRRLLGKTGWVIEGQTVSAIPVAIVLPFIRRKPWRWLLSTGYALTRLFKGLLAYQGIFFCRNPNEPDLL